MSTNAKKEKGQKAAGCTHNQPGAGCSDGAERFAGDYLAVVTFSFVNERPQSFLQALIFYSDRFNANQKVLPLPCTLSTP